MDMQLATRLLQERKRLNLSQTEFAAAGGVVLRTYVNYEKGHPVPDASFLQGIQKTGADVLYILTGEKSSMVGNSPSDASLALQSLIGALKEGVASGRISLAQIQAIDGLIRSL